MRSGWAGRRRSTTRRCEPGPVHALSLAVAQKCNLGCTYCYAQQGDFGGPPKSMPLEVALRAVDLLVEGKEPGARLNLAFLGGEPLVNRAVVQAATRHAAERARGRGVTLTFSITTNGTLLTEGDAGFFEEFGFAVTVSLDGERSAHDALRPYKGGRGTFDRVMANVEPLLSRQRRMQVSARVTVTPSNLELRRTLDAFVAAGFHSVGFSPLLSSQGGRGEMQKDDLEILLGGMIDCGREFVRRSGTRRALPVREPGQRPAGDRAGHPPSLPVRGGRLVPRRLRRGRARGVPPLRRRRGGGHGLPGRRDRRGTAGRLAPRASRPSAGAVPRLLGALPVRRRLPPRGHPPRPARLRLHPGLAALLPRDLSSSMYKPADVRGVRMGFTRNGIGPFMRRSGRSS